MRVLCPVCETAAEQPAGMLYDCPRCGVFALSGTAQAVLPHQFEQDRNRRALLSHLIRRKQHSDGTPIEVFERDFESYWAQRLPTPQQQADSLILWIGENQRYPEEGIQVALPFLSAWIGASVNPNTANSGGIHWLCTYLADEKLLEARPLSSDGGSPWMIRLTMRGWHRFSELQQQGAATSQAFVAMWFNESTEDAWANGLRKGIADAGYDPLRINMKEHVNKICDEIIAEIRRSRFVVADYTGHRGGVYYEAGFAAGRGLPVIPTCRKDEMDKLHFDVRQYNCIDWQTPAELAQRLQARIEAVLGDGPRKH